MSQNIQQPQISVPNLIEKCLDIIEDLISMGEIPQSMHMIDQLLLKIPQNPQLYKKKAFALIQQCRLNQAVQCFNKCIKYSQCSQKFTYLTYKADVLYCMNKITESLALYEKILFQKPKNSKIQYRRGLCYLALNNYSKASRIFTNIQSKSPNYRGCKLMNAHCLYMQKNYRKALNILNYETQRKLNFNQDGQKERFTNTSVLYIKACCYYNLKQYKKCQKQLKIILEIDYSHIQSKILLTIVKAKISQEQDQERLKQIKNQFLNHNVSQQKN